MQLAADLIKKGLRHMIPEMVDLLKQQEGFRAKPYTDSRGFLTIGYGTNLSQGITKDQADCLLEASLKANLAVLNDISWFTMLDPVRQSVIENMAYNMGIGGLLTFRHMIESIKAQDWNGAAKQMLNSEWASQVGNRA